MQALAGPAKKLFGTADELEITLPGLGRLMPVVLAVFSVLFVMLLVFFHVMVTASGALPI
jgi:hypothetical protein